MSAAQLEERVRALEQEVAELKSRHGPPPVADWRRTIGFFRGDAAFREIVETGHAIRQAERSDE